MTPLTLDDMPLFFYLIRNRLPHDRPERKVHVLVQGVWKNKTGVPAGWFGKTEPIFIKRKRPTRDKIEPLEAIKGAFTIRQFLALVTQAGKIGAQELMEYSGGKHWQCVRIDRIELHEEIIAEEINAKRQRPTP